MRALKEESFYTIDDIYDLPDGQRAELIDGQIYNMAPPSRTHQKLVNLFSWAITNYIRSQKGSCEVYPAPFAVFLNKDEKNYVEPDISVICDPSKLDEKGCHGAPDWIIEITSPSNPQMDYGIKLFNTALLVFGNIGLSILKKIQSLFLILKKISNPTNMISVMIYPPVFIKISLLI